MGPVTGAMNQSGPRSSSGDRDDRWPCARFKWLNCKGNYAVAADSTTTNRDTLSRVPNRPMIGSYPPTFMGHGYRWSNATGDQRPWPIAVRFHSRLRVYAKRPATLPTLAGAFFLEDGWSIFLGYPWGEIVGRCYGSGWNSYLLKVSLIVSASNLMLQWIFSSVS